MAPALRFPLSIPPDQFEQDLDKAKGHVGQATRFIVKQFAQANGEVITSTSAMALSMSRSVAGYTAEVVRATAATRAYGQVAGTVFVVGAIVAIGAAFKALNAITDLAKEKMAEYIAIAEGAAAGGVGVDFFQRMTRSAKEAHKDTEEVAKALQNLKEKTEDTLGGASLINRLDELVKAGNFGGNANVDAVKNAADAEARWRAMVALITQAANEGERLAALDLAERFLPPKMLADLRANSNALQEMQVAADKVAATKLIPEEDIGRAIDLKRRLDDAHELLANKFKPIQQDLIGLGLNYHENWVSIVETIARAVDQASQLYGWVKQIGDKLSSSDFAQSDFWKRLADFTGSLGLNSDPESVGIAVDDQAATAANPAMIAARRALAARLKDPNALRTAMQGATGIQSAVRGDESVNPSKDVAETKDAFDRAVDSVHKHIAAMEADAEAVGKTVREHEELRVEAQLTEALLRAGIEINDEYAAKITKLAEAAGAAAEALRRQKDAFQGWNDTLRFGGNELVNVLDRATQRGVKFGDVMSDVLRSVSRQLLQAAITGEGAFAKLLGLNSTTGGVGGLFGLLLGGLSRGFGGSSGGLTAENNFLSFGGPRAGGGPVMPGRFYKVNENTPNSEWFVPKVPGVIVPNEIVPAGGGLVANFGWSIDARGADPSVLPRVEAMIARERAELPGRIARLLPDLRRRSVRGF